jgi:hypothetical protein
VPEIRGIAVSFHDRILWLTTLDHSAAPPSVGSPGRAGLSRAWSIVDLFNITQ